MGKLIKCYCCNTALILKKNASDNDLKNKLYQSEEHIIPNFLGGFLKSKNLLCERCNNDLGIKLEGKLSEELIFYNLVDFPVDRQTNSRKIPGIIEEKGIELAIDEKRFGHFVKPQVLFDENGDFKGVAAKNQEQAIGKLRKYISDNPDRRIEIDNFIKSGNWQNYEDLESVRMDFSNHSFGDDLSYRAVAKIAANFYLYKGGLNSDIKNILRYICVGDVDNTFVLLYYPIFKVFEKKNGELSNCIVIKNNSTQNLLYCYLEIFNTLKIFILLDDQYTGEDVEFVYCWDLLKAKEIVKKPDINIIVNPIKGYYNPFAVQESAKQHFDSFLRFVEKIN